MQARAPAHTFIQRDRKSQHETWGNSHHFRANMTLKVITGEVERKKKEFDGTD